MTNDEAKFILNAYRPSGSDANDATFCAALDQAKLDPALGVWFKWQQSFDRAMTAKLGQAQPPAGLREAILAGAKLSRPETTSRRWWNQPAVVALAASVAVLFAVTAGLLGPRTAAANTGLAEFALADALHSDLHGGHGPGEAELRAMLGQPDLPLSHGLSVDFAGMRASGCRTLNYEGHDLIEVCFKRNGAWFHCYVARRVDFPELTDSAKPMIIDRKGAVVAAWTDEANIYLVAGKTGAAALRQLL
ncbi:MAG: hypothetical protein HY302_13600 [Opitutae bacterium]|nr:hypothetical protein [Opitutae bacterium]